MADHREFEEKLRNLIRESTDTRTAIAVLVEVLAKSGSNMEASRIAALPIEQEVERLERWVQDSRRTTSFPGKATALWFGIIEVDSGVLDLYAAALPGTSAQPSEWSWEKARYPHPKDANSEVLAALSGKNGPATDRAARHLLCLGYATLIAARLSAWLAREGGLRHPLVAAGYDEGDYYVLGRIDEGGRFAPEPEKSTPKVSPLPQNADCFRLDDRRREHGGWILSQPLVGGRKVMSDFAMHGRRVKNAGRCEIPVYSAGKALDVSFTIMEIPVVRPHIADVIERASPKGVQRIPADIEGSAERFELLNVLKTVEPDEVIRQLKEQRASAAKWNLGKHDIVRTGLALRHVVVARGLAEELFRAEVTGIALIPLDKSVLSRARP